MTQQRAEVLRGVNECLVAVLDIGPDGIYPDARIVSDLGADSLDLLDLTFHLEQRFKVRISPLDIQRRTREKLGGEPIETNGVYTPAAVAEFRRAMPEIPEDELHEDLTVAELPRCFRVATMVDLVCRLLDEKAQAGVAEGKGPGSRGEADG